MTFTDLNLGLAAPEIFLAVASLVLLVIGVSLGDKHMRLIAWACVVALVVAIFLTLTGAESGLAFQGLFVADGFARFAKVLSFGAAAVAIIMSLDYAERENMARFELPLLMLLATLGMALMISANDLISLYVGLELQSLALYVVAAIRRDTVKSTEAGLKYFVLGALSSGMLLYGSSLIYGFTGSTNFSVLASALTGEAGLGLIVGIVFLCAGLAFKVSAVPFHMWTPDVYEGAPTPVTAFFASAPKVAAIAMLVRVSVSGMGTATHDWQQIIIFMSLASIVLGAAGAIGQTNIKRLLAYSSINNVGFALVGLAAGTEAGVAAIMSYMAIYVVMTLGSFLCVLQMRDQSGAPVETIASLSGLSQTNKGLAAAFAVFMFSLAGIPPLFGFWAKFLVFEAAVKAGLFPLAAIGIAASVIGAFYYLKIIKTMYFDEPAAPYAKGESLVEKGLIAASAAFIVLGYGLIPVLGSASSAAAKALF